MAEIIEEGRTYSVLNCPCCGVTPLLQFHDCQRWVECSNCGLNTLMSFDISECIAKWNTRTPSHEDALRNAVVEAAMVDMSPDNFESGEPPKGTYLAVCDLSAYLASKEKP